jgi:signal transduction histidine kinase
MVLITAFLLTVVSLLTLYLHHQGIREVLSQFQEQQLSYATHLSNQVQFFIQARSRGLKALSAFASLQYGEVTQLKLDMDTYAQQIEKVYVREISLYDRSGRVVYSTGQVEIGAKKGQDKFFVWARRNENRGKTLLVPALSEPQLLTFILATPLYQEALDSKYPSPSGKFVGVITFTLDMKGFLANQLGSVDPQLSLNQVWIMDKDGTLLFQPHHPEMVLRNTRQREGGCSSCHLSFNYIEEILMKRQGTIDYQIRSHPKKIAAFASMEFGNVSWLVVVNAPYDKVTGFVKKSLRDHLFLIGILALAFVTSSTLIIRNERMKIKAEEEVVRWQEKMAERKKAEDALKESAEQLRYLSSQLLTAQETERKRISRELHDELGQSLTVMKLRLNFIEKSLPEVQTELKRECTESIRYIDQVIEDVRRLSRDLSPAILEDFGLSAALRWLVNNFAKGYNIKVVMDIIDIDSLLPQHSYAAVYRTVQEALTNIGKHSQAKNISVGMTVADGSVRFSIQDDGIGFDERLAASGSMNENGLGLATMKGRAQMAGGVLSVQTIQGQGTLITLSIPMKQERTS